MTMHAGHNNDDVTAATLASTPQKSLIDVGSSCRTN
jgi:hypothetical protein